MTIKKLWFASHLGWKKYKNSGQHFKAKTNMLLAAEPGRGISHLWKFYPSGEDFE